MSVAGSTPSAATRARIAELFAGLEISVLGGVYCETGGEAFWAEHLQPTEDLGLAWAEALGQRLRTGGRSLYVGAGVAELPALCFEHLDLGRELRICNLSTAESESLNRSVRALGLGEALRWQPVDAAGLMSGGFDHLSVVSVFSDPQEYPQCSALGYGRIPPALIDLQALAAERQRLDSLAQSLLGMAADGALLTTTGEDLPWFLAAAERQGWQLRVEDGPALETAVVGDPLGFARLIRA